MEESNQSTIYCLVTSSLRFQKQIHTTPGDCCISQLVHSIFVIAVRMHYDIVIAFSMAVVLFYIHTNNAQLVYIFTNSYVLFFFNPNTIITSHCGFDCIYL